jgi:hypothetical protein
MFESNHGCDLPGTLERATAFIREQRRQPMHDVSAANLDTH